MTSRGRPWVVGSVGLLAVAVALLPSASEQLILNRERLLAGQIWRLWSGHLVHYGAAHLAWNLCAAIPAGVWLEISGPRLARIYLALAPVMISVSVLLFSPGLENYAGLSGIGVGLLVLLALVQLRSGDPRVRGIWFTLLGAVALKLVLEAGRPTPLLAGGNGAFRNVPVAHYAGAAIALLLFGFGQKRLLRDLKPGA